MPAASRPKSPPRDQHEQSERFIAMAKELGADESEERFNEKLKKVARAKLEEKSAVSDSGPLKR